MYSQAYVWEHVYNDKVKSDSIKNIITSDFPGSEIANYILDTVPEDSIHFYENQNKIYEIEKEYIDQGNYTAAIKALKGLLESRTLDNKNHAFVAYKIAWLYDYELSLEQNTQDSTLHYYYLVSSKHPGTPLATQSSHRIAEIETQIRDYLAFLSGDSLKPGEVDIDSTLLAATESGESEIDKRELHPIYRRLKSPGRPRPVRL